MTSHPDLSGDVPRHRPAWPMAGDPVLRTAVLILCVIATVAALDVGQVILAPVCLSIVVGAIFAPAARCSKASGCSTDQGAHTMLYQLQQERSA